jgi:hypothetical protein
MVMNRFGLSSMGCIQRCGQGGGLGFAIPGGFIFSGHETGAGDFGWSGR